MKVLVVGSGGREHALAWALSRSGRVDALLTLPGNPGTARLGDRVPDVDPSDVGAVAAVARVLAVDLVVVGPEVPLSLGVIDALDRLGIPAFGPSRAAARLEASKAFAKQVMRRAGVPTADWRAFTELDQAEEHLRRHPGPYVVKADGLAAGKGVLVTSEREAALAWTRACLEGRFGEAGSTVVIEELLRGPELSAFAVCDGESAVLLEPARDHKRLRDGDAGPNTGGMGSFSPVALPDRLLEEVHEHIVLPTLRTLADDGTPYVGFLYVGLALTEQGPQVIEYNCRLGDPEAQVLLPRLETDLVDLVEAALHGGLAGTSLSWSPRSAVDVVLASAGYPESARRGDPIRGVRQAEEMEDVLVLHAGTTGDSGRLLTAGGRVLNVVGMGDDLEAARSRAYAAVERISFPGMQYRTDIGAG